MNSTPPIKGAERSERLAGLDGLRAISVSVVVLFHLSKSYRLDGIPVLRTIADYGNFGVQIFFVISGFLITWLLLIEESQNGRFSVSAFYVRRALRILPPALFYLLVVSCLVMAGWADASPFDLTASALFFRNLIPGSTETAHYWTLSVEEQFYLLWPAILILIQNNRIRLSFCLAVIALGPIWHHINNVMEGADNVNFRRLDIDNIGALLTGCALAFLRFDPMFMELLRKPFLQNPLTAFGSVTLMLWEMLGPVPRHLSFQRTTVEWACVALLISYLVDKPRGWAGTVLNSAPVAWLGTLSYSLYIWQMLFVKDYPTRNYWIRGFPQNLVASLMFACISFYFLERPFSRLRKALFAQTKFNRESNHT